MEIQQIIDFALLNFCPLSYELEQFLNLLVEEDQKLKDIAEYGEDCTIATIKALK